MNGEACGSAIDHAAAGRRATRPSLYIHIRNGGVGGNSRYPRQGVRKKISEEGRKEGKGGGEEKKKRFNAVVEGSRCIVGLGG